MNKIFLLNFNLQKDAIDRHCFGTCKKILAGQVNFMGREWMVCASAPCLHSADDLGPLGNTTEAAPKEVWGRRLVT